MLSEYNDDERKKREEEFDAMFSNNAINNSDYQQRATEFDNVFGGNNIDYQTRANEFDAIFGNKQEEAIDTNANVDDTNGIDLSKYPDLEPGDSVEKMTISLNNNEIEGVPQYVSPEVEKEAQKANIPTVQEGNLRAVNKQTIPKLSVDNQEHQNTTKVTNTQIEALEKAQEKNKNIEKGGVEKFNEFADSILNNIMGGFAMKPAAGLYNALTTIAGLGIKGLEGATRILGFDETSEKLNNVYNSIVESGSDVKAKADYASTVNNQVNDDFIRTSANVADIVSNVAGNAAIGYVTGVSGTVIQGLSVGGSSAQEVLEENKDNIIQASLTGIAKGYVSYLTEKMFDANILTRGEKRTSVEKFINRMISNNINSKFGKEIANRLIGIVGENVEELAEDNAGYLIDKLVNNKDMPGFQEWWNNTTETAKMTTISTIVLELLGLGGGKFEDIEKDMETEYWIDQAQQIIDKEDLAIHFNTDEVKNMNNTQNFYITKFKQDGEIENLVPTRGKEINSPNSNLNIAPVIVKDNQTNYYNIIDGNTGVILDSTLYSTTIEAENGFNEKVNQLSDLQVRDINNKVGKANYTITNKLIETINQAKNQINDNQDLRNIDNANSETNTNINNTLKNTLEMIGQIQDRTIYKNKQANNIFKSISNDLDTINYITQSGNNYLNSLDKNGKVVYQQKLNKKLYTGSDMKNVIYNAIANADIPNRIQTTTKQNTGNLNVEPTSDTNRQQNLTQGNINKVNGTNNNPSESNFYTGNKKYILKDINKTTGYFKNNKQYKLPDIEEIYNFDMETEDITTYDDKGNETGYIDIVQNGENVKIQQYDNDNNVIKEQFIPSKNGKVSGKTVNEAIKEITTDYDVNRPIKGQFDIEGNQVRNIKKSKMIDEQIRDIVKYNQDGREIKDENYVDFMVERYKDNKNISGIEITTDETNEILKSTYEKALSLVDSQDEKTIKNKQKNLIIDEMFEKIKDKKFKIEKTFIDENKNENKIILDLEITKKGLNESLNKSLSIEKISVIPYLDKLIKTSENGITRNETKNRRNILGWYYIYNTAMINNKLYGVKIDLKKTNLGDRFYVHRVNIIKGDLNFVPSFEYATKENLKAPTINNSIPQKEQNVKNETAINKKSMQKEENNTSNDDIRSMKKPSPKVEYDNQGRKITKDQAQYFQNSKVRDTNGNLIVMYHGTNANFNIFKNKKAQNGRAITDGYYFTTNKQEAQTYGTNLKEVYIDIKKPFYLHSYNGVVTELKERGYNIEELIKNGMLEADEGGVPTAKSLKKFLQKNEYDGVITLTGTDEQIDMDYQYNQVVIFKSNQAKEISNISPTSNDDIRYMKKDKNQTKNTTNKPYDEREQKGVVNKTAKELYQDELLQVDDSAAKTNAEGSDRYIEQQIKMLEKAGAWDYTIPPTSRSDIRKTIEDYLGLGIKRGHFRQKAYGIYKPVRDVIRVKEYKDMDNVLHEVGHALDLGNRIKVDKESIANELFTAIDKHGGYEEESRTVRLDEGFAEVIREYTIVPEQTKKDYPQTVAVLEEIRKQDKSFDNFIKKVQQQTYNYIHQSPQNRLHSNQSIGKQTDKVPLTKNWIKQKVVETVWDKDFAAKMITNKLAKVQGKTFNEIKASENMYYMIRLANATGSKAISMLSDGYIDTDGNKLFPGLNRIGKILGDDPQRYNDLRDYLVAQRDLEYKAKTLKTGIRTMDSKTVVNKFKNDIQIQEAAQLIYDTLDGVMQYAINNNLIDQETADKLRESNVFYVPMQRVLDNDMGNKIGKRGAVQDVIKKRIGSELDVKDVLENIIANSVNIIQQVENNNVLKALYKEGEQAGLTGTVYDKVDTPMIKIGTAQLSTWEAELKKQGVNTKKLDLEKTIDIFAPNNKTNYRDLITSFIDDEGNRIYLQFMDKSIFTSIMGADQKSMSTILKLSNKVNMPLRYGATMANLGFAIPNMISDTAQASVFSTAGFIPVVDNAIGVLDVLTAENKSVQNFMNKFIPEYVEKINRIYTLYNQSGASTATRMSQYRKSTQEQMKNVYGTKSENLSIDEKFKPLKRLMDIMTYIPEISEQSTRLRVFEKNYDYYKNKGNSETDARIMAALESRDATQDFSRSGNLTREINQLIPFSAARVGSAYTFAEKVYANPKVVGMRIAILTAIAMGIKAIGYDDDEIEELNQRKKDDNFALKIGDSIVTIKKPQGILRSIINLAEYIQDLVTGHIEEGKEGDRLKEWTQNAIMDNMPADDVTGFVPNMVAPVIENAINKDLYYKTDIVKSYDLELPDSEQYYDYNSQLAIWLGKVFNYSPAKIDNLISGYFAGLGTTVTSTMDYWLGKLGIIPEEPEMGAEKDTIGKRFFVNVNSNSQSAEDIYNLKTELTKKKNGGTITEEESEQLENITQAISQMAALNKQIKSIKADENLSGEEKAEQIKILQSEKTDTARQALGKDLINSSNATKIETTKFYPSRSTLTNNGYTLEMTTEMQKEYSQIASDKYNQYAKQGIYSDEYLEKLKTKCKEYAKNYMMNKYKSQLTKSN